MLIGEYTHTIDDKNRVSLPAKFRAILGKKLILAPGFDNCLFLFTEKEWAKVAQRLSENSSMLSHDMRSFTRYMFAGAFEAPVDGAGRMLIPEVLRQRSGLEAKVAMIGVQNRVEIWNEAAWAEYRDKVEKEADGLAEKLSGLGIM